MGYSPPGSSVHGILQAWVLEWVAISFSRESSQPRDWSWVSHTTGRFFTIWATREADPDRRRQTISYIRWHRSRWAEAWRTVLKNWDSTGKNSQVLGKHVKSPVTRKSHRTGGQGRFQYSSFWLPSWGPVATSCLLTNGPVLLLSGMEQLIYLFLLILKKKMEFGKNGKKSLI